LLELALLSQLVVALGLQVGQQAQMLLDQVDMAARLAALPGQQ
jgi:hypothetical protein